MNMESLKKLLALSLIVVAGHSWATVAPTTLPTNTTTQWNDIASVAWSTDGGAHYGQSVLSVGQNVLFQFTLHKTDVGNHYADFMKVWLDSNKDGDFVDPVDTAILFGVHVVNKSAPSVDQTNKLDGGLYKFTTSLTITNGMVGDNYLLARVTCSESLLNVAGFNGNQWSYSDSKYNSMFSPVLSYYQGESEFAKFTVRGNQVPEPGSLALVGLGFLGMIQMRKARKA
jgi:hypothetical protein